MQELRAAIAAGMPCVVQLMVSRWPEGRQCCSLPHTPALVGAVSSSTGERFLLCVAARPIPPHLTLSPPKPSAELLAQRRPLHQLPLATLSPLAYMLLFNYPPTELPAQW